MRIFFNEISNQQETELDYTQADKWVADTVARYDERHADEIRRPGAAAPARDARTHLTLRKVDDILVLNGNLETSVQLICSRCANYFQFPIDSTLSALYCKDPSLAGIAHLSNESGKPVGQTHGWARHEHDTDGETGTGTTDASLDITYVAEDFLDLSDVLAEQMRLEIPFQPLCKESCKGICLQCGADLNIGKCACAKLERESPFASLKKLDLGAAKASTSSKKGKE